MKSLKPLLTLRPESEQDKAFLETLHRSTHDDLLQLGLPEQMLDNLLLMQFNAQQQGYRAQFPDADFAIIERTGEPIGYLISHHADAAIRVVYLALLPQARNRGYGRYLLQALQEAATFVRKPLTLSVGAQNVQAQRLYLSLGFQIQKNDGVNLEMVWLAGDNR